MALALISVALTHGFINVPFPAMRVAEAETRIDVLNATLAILAVKAADLKLEMHKTSAPPPINVASFQIYSGGAVPNTNAASMDATFKTGDGSAELTDASGDVCTAGRAFNLVIVRAEDGVIVECKHWDIYGSQDAAKAFAAWLTGTGSEDLHPYKNRRGFGLFLAVKDSAEKHGEDYVVDIISVLGANLIAPDGQCCLPSGEGAVSGSKHLGRRAGYVLAVDLGTMTNVQEWHGVTQGSSSTQTASIIW